MNPEMATAHREGFLAALDQAGSGAIAVLPTGKERVRSRDTHYRFRPDSDFWYLTAFPEPDAVAVLIPGRKEGPFILFVRPRDPEMEIWHGKRFGVEGAQEVFGADEAYPIGELDRCLPSLLKGAKQMYYRTGENADFDRKLLSWLSETHLKTRDGITGPGVVRRPGELLHEMRLVKSEDEIDFLRRAADITSQAHQAAMKALGPGTAEYEIEALVDGTFRRLGGWGPGYPSIVAGGSNACILHYTENMEVVSEGDLLLLDAGCEINGYTADVTRTFPSTGKFSEVQRVLYEVVLNAQLRGIEMVSPGNTFYSIHEETTATLVQGMIDAGLLDGDLQENLESEAYRRYFMHKTSHWLGIDVHDVGSYFQGSGEGGDPVSRPLEPGMVLTVEPGIYVSPEDEKAPERFRGLGIRIEDDVLVTAEGHDVLTGSIPKTVDDVEAAC